MLTKTVSTLIAISALGFAAGAAHAGPAADPDALTMKVSVAGIDLRTEAGAQQALQRIKSAARFICGDSALLRDIDAYSHQRACMQTTVDGAVTTLNSPVVASLSHTAVAAATYTEARR